METTIDSNDVISAITGIVNARLVDGIDDGTETHSVTVVIWRLHTNTLAGYSDLAVIVHVDGTSVAPFNGSQMSVNFDHGLSRAAELVAIRAERIASEEIDRRETTLATIAAAL